MDHYLAFYKHLPICDLFLGSDFLKKIQVHYDMNLELETLTKKLQMFTYSCILTE